jgi:plastocyanin
MSTRTGLAATALVTAAVMAGGCGGDDEGSSGGQAGSEPAATATEAPGQSVSEVAMSDDLKFSPDSVTASQGASITVKNAGSIQHDLKLRQDGSEAGGTELVDGGKSTTFKVTVEPGSYEMYCSVAGHEQGGMKGTFTVE